MKENDKETVISIKNYDKTVTVVHPYNDVTIDEMVKDFVTLMEGIKFFHSQILDAFKRYIDDYEEE